MQPHPAARTYALACKTLKAEVDPERGLLHANPILCWYQADFGGRQGLLNLLAQHRQEIDPQRSWQFNWTTYDWSI